MSYRPKFKLSRLREIGWSLWDPIGLRQTLEAGNDSVADEYDSYLLQAAGRLWNGEPQEAVARYLVEIERDHMGLGDSPGAHTTASSVAEAIGTYVESLRQSG